MAACLISVTGTVGVIRINYTISGIPYTIETSIGEFYIEDTATDVTYTTLSGDLSAVDDGCLTPPIAELAANCYKISWNSIESDYTIANAIFLGYGIGGEITIPDTSFPNTPYNFMDIINNLGDDRVKVIGYKTVGYDTTFPNFSRSYILKVLGTERPDLRIRNTDNTGYIFIHGVLQPDCLPQAGYTIVDPCYNTLPPAP